jgi:hypothetical protein
VNGEIAPLAEISISTLFRKLRFSEINRPIKLFLESLRIDLLVSL